jgi:GNAT superfamily N-acetyltransferase
MQTKENHLRIRRFRNDDAHFCYQIRKQAFLTLFVDEVGELAAKAGSVAYQPEDYIRIAKESAFFIAESGSQPAGFFIIKKIDHFTGQLYLIYFDQKVLKRGFGRKCMQFIDDWVRANWQKVQTLHVDTIIPLYNSAFYQKMGYEEVESINCDFSGIAVNAVRLQKHL